MSIMLKIALFWVPDLILKREIDNVAKNTIEGLDRVLKQYAPKKMQEIQNKDEVLCGDIDQRRKIMAKAHNIRVKVLIEALGYDNAIKTGRKAMFKVGNNLGEGVRRRLGVGDDFKDMEAAAKILYKILGIKFKIENKDGNIIMVVKRCALSKYYTPEACIILSAADEGVVKGLNKKLDMKFKERITEGASECLACINEVKT